MLWQQILESDQPWMRRTAQRSLTQLQALDQIDELQALVLRADLPAGRRVTWTDLVRRGDPAGRSCRSGRHAVSTRSGQRPRHDLAASSLNPMPDLLRPFR